MLMVTFTLEIGRTTRHTALVFITTLMELNTKVTGLRINKMDMAKKPGLTMLAMKVIIRMARSMALEYSTGLMDQHTTGHL